jgi:hypothetical protein
MNFTFNVMDFQKNDVIVTSFDWNGERDQMVYLVHDVQPGTRDGQQYTVLLIESPFDSTPKPWPVEAFLSRDDDPKVEIRQRDGNASILSQIAGELGL